MTMSTLENETMAEPQPMEESDWQGIDKTVDDPEEARVMFCALDSFLSVCTPASLAVI